MRPRRLISTLMIVAFLPLTTTACFGKFNLVRKVYKLNEDVSTDKWVRWIAFLILTIVPIYGIASFVDALVLNSVEFWTGQNPIMAGTSRTTLGPNGEVGVSTLREDGAIDLSITERDGHTHYLKLVRELGGVSAYDADDNLIANMDGTLAWAQR